jgi:hypothetical protein
VKGEAFAEFPLAKACPTGRFSVLSRSITSVDSIYHGGKNKLILSPLFVAEVSSMKTTANNLKVLQMKHAITNTQTWHLLKVLVLFIACLPAFSGCSSVEGTGENQRVTTRFLQNIEQEHEKPANPPVHLGQPYIMDPERTLD